MKTLNEKGLACERELLAFRRDDRKSAEDSEEGLGGVRGIRACFSVALKLFEVARLMSSVGDRPGSNELVAEAIREIQDNLVSFDEAIVNANAKKDEFQVTRVEVDELEGKLKQLEEQNKRLLQNYAGVGGAAGAVLNSQRLSNNR